MNGRMIVAGLAVLYGIYGVLNAATNFAANEELADSAPQQTLAALWSIRDLAELVAILLIAMLVVLAWPRKAPQPMVPRHAAPIEEAPGSE